MKRILIVVICLCAFPFFIQAQPFTLEPNIKPIELKLHKFEPEYEEKAKGKLSITDVRQVKDTMYYFVKGVSIYSPTYVGIQALDPAQPVKVSLHKMAWKNADRKGETNGDGVWNETFKTENDFGIRVIASTQPVEYSVIVWAGDEAKMELPGIFKNAENSDDTEKNGKGFFSQYGTYLIIAVLAILVLFLLYKNKKNKNG